MATFLLAKLSSMLKLPLIWAPTGIFETFIDKIAVVSPAAKETEAGAVMLEGRVLVMLTVTAFSGVLRESTMSKEVCEAGMDVALMFACVKETSETSTGV